MYTRLMLIAAMTAMSAAPGAAEPVRVGAQQASEQAGRPAQTLLAQADIRTPAPPSDTQVDAQADAQSQAQTPAPVKRPRVGRVSSCRCGGELPEQP